MSTALAVDAEASDQELIDASRAGCDAAVSELLTRYRRLVHDIARHYYAAGADHDDVVQEGMVGLYKAVRSFDATAGAGFRTFAQLCIRRQIINAIDAAARRKHALLTRSVLLDREMELLEGGSALEARNDPADVILAREGARALADYCRESLTPFECAVLSRYVDGESYEDIALALGMSAKAVDNALQRIRRKATAQLRPQIARAG
jgi:RNA polymerase sporulation-specific sigma factor